MVYRDNEYQTRLPVPSIGDSFLEYAYISLNLINYLCEGWEHIEIRGLPRISHVLRTKYKL